MEINQKLNRREMKTVNYYRNYGFSDLKELLNNAYSKNYIVPSFNFITMEQLNAIGYYGKTFSGNTYGGA